jgi:hypothetical protein
LRDRLQVSRLLQDSLWAAWCGAQHRDKTTLGLLLLLASALPQHQQCLTIVNSGGRSSNDRAQPHGFIVLVEFLPRDGR